MTDPSNTSPTNHSGDEPGPSEGRSLGRCDSISSVSTDMTDVYGPSPAFSNELVPSPFSHDLGPSPGLSPVTLLAGGGVNGQGLCTSLSTGVRASEDEESRQKDTKSATPVESSDAFADYADVSTGMILRIVRLRCMSALSCYQHFS